MTIYQEAHQKTDQFPEKTVYLFIQLMDNMRVDTIPNDHKRKNINKFLETAGMIDIDEEAIYSLREKSNEGLAVI